MFIDKKSVWVVVADSSACRLYQLHKHPAKLELFKALSHPENKLRDLELTSDKPGRYRGGADAGHGAFSQQTDPKEIKIDDFSREIARELDSGRKSNAYDALILISPPRVNGRLFQHASKHVKDLVAHNIEKDLVHLDDRDLLSFIDAYIDIPR